MDEYLKIFRPAKGKMLDRIGYLYDLPRKRYFIIFKESDKKYRKRILDKVNSCFK